MKPVKLTIKTQPYTGKCGECGVRIEAGEWKGVEHYIKNVTHFVVRTIDEDKISLGYTPWDYTIGTETACATCAAKYPSPEQYIKSMSDERLIYGPGH